MEAHVLSVASCSERLLSPIVVFQSRINIFNVCVSLENNAPVLRSPVHLSGLHTFSYLFHENMDSKKCNEKFMIFICLDIGYKVKANLSLWLNHAVKTIFCLIKQHAVKAHCRSGGIAPLTPNFESRWSWVAILELIHLVFLLALFSLLSVLSTPTPTPTPLQKSF
jgi:hypothetical protein